MIRRAQQRVSRRLHPPLRLLLAVAPLTRLPQLPPAQLHDFPPQRLGELNHLLQRELPRARHRVPHPSLALALELPRGPAAVPREELEVRGLQRAVLHELARAVVPAEVHPG
eukprot:29591-Pelagococcus_subviridis.AAC.3